MNADLGNLITRIRIKITDRCNYRCFFCHREGSEDDNARELTEEDIRFVLNIFRKLGISRLKITGGEPLLRRDVVNIVRISKDLGYGDVSLTTNGLLLDLYAKELLKSGLDRIDISLHTLNPKKYAKITGTCVEYFYKVLNNIYDIHDLGFRQVKINMLVTTLNIEDIPEMIRFAKKLNISLQLIEYMPIGRGAIHFKQYYIPLRAVFYVLSRRAKHINFRRDLHNRPILYIDGVRIEFIMGFRNPEFCSGCRQLRLTSDGKLRYCIYRNDYEDIYDMIKSRDEYSIVKSILRIVERRRPMFY